MTYSAIGKNIFSFNETKTFDEIVELSKVAGIEYDQKALEYQDNLECFDDLRDNWEECLIENVVAQGATFMKGAKIPCAMHLKRSNIRPLRSGVSCAVACQSLSKMIEAVTETWSTIQKCDKVSASKEKKIPICNSLATDRTFKSQYNVTKTD
ncbi:hypothetical protein AVEN_61438-1 [Araneus ventricosus]|uniref:Uncharacterized protein n=1 Tax=Araneus ventricosus TaxID=182803 RepID=A0A4Y2MB96_ARAVE|nr:hypothetical protein AVEN_61438-1 [Araneus ventricosus]